MVNSNKYDCNYCDNRKCRGDVIRDRKTGMPKKWLVCKGPIPPRITWWFRDCISKVIIRNPKNEAIRLLLPWV